MIEVTREMNAPRQRTRIPAEPDQDQHPPKKGSVPQRKTLSWDEIEDWQKDNEYIVHGYRRTQYSWLGCIESVCGCSSPPRLSNPVNIHSHLWGSALFVYFLGTVTGIHPDATWRDMAVFSVFLLSAVFCLSGSAIYHTATCHSLDVATGCHALDYSGIIVLIVGSFFPSIYYGFWCHPTLQYLLPLGASMVVLNPEYAKPTHRTARTVVFIGLGLCAVFPIGHILLTTHGFRELLTELGFGWLVVSGAMYIVGATVYAMRFPEKLSPGTFDYFLASHQIFHCFVVLAALMHYKSALTSLDYRMTNSECYGHEFLWSPNCSNFCPPGTHVPPCIFEPTHLSVTLLFGKLLQATSGYDGSCRRPHDAFNLRSFRGSWSTRSFYVRLALPMVYHCCRVVLVRQPSQTQGKGGSTLPELGAFILPTLSRLALIGMPNIVSAILEIAPLFTSAVLL
ncbi:HlyIII-domain-containing protein [Coprinellus micaceus]|uniref:HlyIII-domain-containing protein n=1 Tax=Coprinellus micaceus TaxID=71717 RepID=A0A4Y7TJN7_COPMI|nr:HlyIII-domain-containing protein [Coprinellus micaceus]